MMSDVTHNVTSSQASGAGPTPSTSPGGRGRDPSGPPASPASPSAPPEREGGTTTTGTSGPSSGASSRSADLQFCLESRLLGLLEGTGSPEFVLTWRLWGMQSGLRIFVLQARAHPTPVSGCSGELRGWTTPNSRDWKDVASTEALIKASVNQTNLPRMCALVCWATPTATDGNRNGEAQMNHRNPTLVGQALGSGPPLNSYRARAVRYGALNPAHSRWLQGFPATWDECSPHWRAWSEVQASIASGAFEATATR
jgi:hypothetical protein